ERRALLRRRPRPRADRRRATARAAPLGARRGRRVGGHQPRDLRHVSAPPATAVAVLARRSAAAPAAAEGVRIRPLSVAGGRAMTLRAKLTLMFFGALQVTFLTAVGTFWAVQSWQLLTDDLTLIHAQNLRLERTLEGAAAFAGTTLPPEIPARVTTLREHAQTVEEADLIDGLGRALATPGPARGEEAGQRLKKYYAGEVRRAREQARFVTRLSTGLFFAIVTVVLAGMMAYFAAIRVWLVRPLQALGRATGVISTGDLEHRVPMTGRDEFGTLAASINTMAASLAENQRRLVAAERFAAIGEMSAYVAHNIRNPLASIRTTAQAELLAAPQDDPSRTSFADIVTAADRLESWVGDLLRFASPVTLDRRPEELNALVGRCIELVRTQLAAKTLELDVGLDPHVGTVPLDRNKIEQ